MLFRKLISAKVILFLIIYNLHAVFLCGVSQCKKIKLKIKNLRIYKHTFVGGMNGHFLRFNFTFL